MKHIGIVGITAEGAALCYRTICSESTPLLGLNNHPEISLHQFPFLEYHTHLQNKDFEKVGRLILKSIEKLKKSGADFAIIPSNTPHYAWRYFKKDSQLPLLSIVEITADECVKQKFERVGVLGTKSTMSGGLYQEPLKKRKIDYVVPSSADQEKINNAIFNEIIPDKYSDTTSNVFIEIVKKLKRQGCDGVILGCTEIPLVINEKNSPLPIIDTTRVLAVKALEYALT